MNRNLSPKAMHLAVWGAVDDTVWGAVDDTVWGAVWEAVRWAVGWAVYGAVSRAVSRAVSLDFSTRPPHPNLDRFLIEVRKARGDAP